MTFTINDAAGLKVLIDAPQGRIQTNTLPDQTEEYVEKSKDGTIIFHNGDVQINCALPTNTKIVVIGGNNGGSVDIKNNIATGCSIDLRSADVNHVVHIGGMLHREVSINSTGSVTVDQGTEDSIFIRVADLHNLPKHSSETGDIMIKGSMGGANTILDARHDIVISSIGENAGTPGIVPLNGGSVRSDLNAGNDITAGGIKACNAVARGDIKAKTIEDVMLDGHNIWFDTARSPATLRVPDDGYITSPNPIPPGVKVIAVPNHVNAPGQQGYQGTGTIHL